MLAKPQAALFSELGWQLKSSNRRGNSFRMWENTTTGRAHAAGAGEDAGGSLRAPQFAPVLTLVTRATAH